MNEQHQANPKVYIIIINWNGASDTLECLASLDELAFPNFEMIVVDNGSTDNSVKIIKDKYPGVTILEAKANLGFTGGNNLGIRYALERGADYVWLLNNDTAVEQDALSQLVRAACLSPENGIVGSVIYDYEDRSKIQFAGADIKWKKARSPHMFTLNHRDIFSVARVNGCSMLVSRSVCETVGLFDENYFLYAEEVDWCVRASNANFKCLIAPESKVYHKVSVTVNKVAGKNIVMRYYNTRNFLYLIDKLCPYKIKKLIIYKQILKHIRKEKLNFMKMVLSSVLGKDLLRPGDSPKLFAVRDFMTKNMGKTLFIK